MTRVAVVTDSSSCLPTELLENHHIMVVPLAFLFDGQLHYDGSLSSREFYDLLSSSRRFPTTTSPAPGAFLEAFRRASGQAQAALCITLPSRFSGTYSSATNAAELARQELPNFPIRVMESGGLAMSHGFSVLAAARAAAAGATLDEAASQARDVGSRAHLVGVLDSMRYLAKSGRVPWIVHWGASLLRIKPVLAARGDAIKAIGRVRTLRRGLDQLLRYVEKHGSPADGGGLRMAVMHANCPDIAQELSAVLKQRWRPTELLVAEFTSVMGIHTGPGFVGLAYYSEAPVPQQPQPAAAGGAAGSRDGSQNTPTLEEDVLRLQTSLGALPPPQAPPALIVVSGLPGSGKSHFSHELCRRRPLVRLESDALRKALFPRPVHSAEESARLFAACHELLDRLLADGQSVILDATNLREIHRRPLYRIAERREARLVLVRMKAPPSLIRRRLEARAQSENPWDASDADIAVYERMRKQAEPIRRPHIVADSSRDLEPAIRAVLQEMAGVA